ncbi:dTDP-4-dehydrorhamnose 3,5-epimerase [Mycobacterium sp. M1]|uniref:dTDP-4-dehydrorhamnose 3,5-epimerase n=1 Tax=Mycolicibacter acidiphilus TaxID=2835306 RepID=A0ABS5RKP0_9MYCO|nr:dTDP-4-dehydrorhamnose 3,5-epimerase [Mycolicibacter acidiphilus]MBS9533494.1 dTDP-4-dehydrorhamnose 3,5-epimerase [Mycolicibacter acidiphilus]
MRYTETDIAGVMIVDIEPHHDERGFFSRSFCSDEFAAYGLDPSVAQTNISFNHTAGTVRGLHRQAPPYAEAKLVRCTRGALVDVAVDVRPESPSYGRHVMVQLTAENRRALFIPPYVAHGFQSLVDFTEILYLVSGRYLPDGQEGFRWDDPNFGIQWPLPVTAISERDANCPLLDPTEVEREGS